MKRQFFVQAEILQLMAAEGVTAPRAPNGSGRRGRVVKYDLVKALVRHHFPNLEEESPEEFEEICHAVSNRGKAKIVCPEDVIEAVGTLDPENEQAFSEIIKDAREQKEKIAAKELEVVIEEKYKALYAEREQAARAAERDAPRPAAAPEPPAERAAPAARAPAAERAVPVARITAPPEFKQLLPQVDFLYFHWEPQHRRTRVVYKQGIEHPYQKSKTSTWPASGTAEQKLDALAVVFDWVSDAYHRRFRDSPGYQADYVKSPAST